MTPPDNYTKPEWFLARRVHDWRNHVSDSVRALWPTFTDVQRAALALQAEEQADAEEWE